MNSKIYSGIVSHKRFEKRSHEFDYPVYFYAFDLSELENLSKTIPGFGYNCFSLSSIYDKDYLNRGSGTIREKLDNFLKGYELQGEVSKVILVTSARYLGYAFNPVSFYYCFDSNDEIICIVMEVNNTFGERHLYILNELRKDSEAGFIEARTKKEFHVSPFFDMFGEYQCSFSELTQSINISIDLLKKGNLAIATTLKGDSNSFNFKNYRRIIFRFPITALLTMLRIHFQAFKLFFNEKLQIYRKPIANHPMTIRKKKPGFIGSIARKIVLNVFSRIRVGGLTVILPEGEKIVFGDSLSDIHVSMSVFDNKFFKRIIADANIGFAESYIEKEWDSDQPLEILKLFALNKEHLSLNQGWFGKVGVFLNQFRHSLRKNSKNRSRKNISEHYDLSNEFFSLFLDPTMTYSSAIFKNKDDSLETAQKNKISTLIKKARITKDSHVLEIGCGWGAFAIEAVKQTGCRVTGITLSKEQLKYAQQRVAEEGLSERIELKLCDYRDMEGKFDRIVSIEMLEAVGHEYFENYFECLDKLLKPHGLIAIQVITIPDQRYEGYRKRCDFIQKYIFPGGLLPSLEIMTKTLTKYTDLHIEHLENIGPDYARTLHFWHEAFKDKCEDLLALGWDERAQRIWAYYFMYCEAGFATRNLNTLQLILTRSENKTLMNNRECRNQGRVIYAYS